MSSTSEAYLDIITGVERRWPVSYDECIMRTCPDCRAERMDMCTNPINGRPRKTPCLLRVTQGWG